MKLYLCSIKSYQLDLGIESSAFDHRRLERTIQGIKRNHNKPEKRDRTPLTRPFLCQILQTLDPTSYDDAVIRAAFTLAFAAFLRVGEFTYRKSDLATGPCFGTDF